MQWTNFWQNRGTKCEFRGRSQNRGVGKWEETKKNKIKKNGKVGNQTWILKFARIRNLLYFKRKACNKFATSQWQCCSSERKLCTLPWNTSLASTLLSFFLFFVFFMTFIKQQEENGCSCKHIKVRKIHMFCIKINGLCGESAASLEKCDLPHE